MRVIECRLDENWMNSILETRQPARQPIAIPSPVAVSGFVVYRYTFPAPPVARMVSCAAMVITSPVRQLKA